MIKRRLLTIISMCGALAFSAGTLSAATVDFDLTSGNGTSNPGDTVYTFTDPDATLTVTTDAGSIISQSGGGLGVDDSWLENGESLTFSFSPGVEEVTVVFREFGSDNEDIQVTINFVTEDIVINGFPGSLQTVDIVAAFSTDPGIFSEFTLAGVSGTSVQVHELTVETVPVPPALLLMLSGILGMAYVARKRA